MVKIFAIISASWIFFAQTYFLLCTSAVRLPFELEFSLRTMLLSINSSVNPCDDFYGFACGTWAKNNFYRKGFLPPGADAFSSEFYDNVRFSEDRIEAQLGKVLQENHKTVGQTVENIFYQKCLDQGHWPMAKLLSRTSNGHQWPILYSHPQSDYLPSWDHLLSTFHFTLDVSPLITFTPYSNGVHPDHQNKMGIGPPPISDTFVSFSAEEMVQLMTFWHNTNNRLSGVNHRNPLPPNSFIVWLRVLEVMQLQFQLQSIKTFEIFEENEGTEKVIIEGGLMTIAQFEALTSSRGHHHQWTDTFNNLLRQSMDRLWFLVNFFKLSSKNRINYHYPKSDFHKVHTTLEILQLARQLAASGKRIFKGDPNAHKLTRLATLLDHAQLEQITAWINFTSASNNSNNFTSGLSKEKYERFFIEPFSFYQPEVDHLFVYDLAYFRRLVLLMETTPRHVIFNYLALHAISRWRNYQRGLFLNTNLQSGKLPLWKYCVQRTIKIFPWTMSHWYLLKNNHQNPNKLKRIKEKVSRMVAIAKDHFDVVIRTADWLDEQTRAAALVKLHSTRAFIAYPDWLLKQYEEKLEKKQVSALQQIEFLNMAVHKISFDRVWRHLLLYDAGRLTGDASSPPPSSDFDGWPETPIQVTAYHFLQKNSITIPFALLQPPMFTYLEKTEEGTSKRLHDHYETTADLLNTGSLLPVIAHELLHGFEQQGSLFDQTGFFSDWWTPHSRMNLMTRSQCLLRQKTFRNTQTLIEDTADNGALKVAHGAFRQWKQKSWSKRSNKRSEHSLPYFRHLKISARSRYTFYSPEQMFFLAYAQSFCAAGTYSEEMFVDRVHSFEPERVNLPVNNLEGGAPFSKAFNCPRDKRNFLFQPKNPVFKYQNDFASERCEVW